MQTNENDPLIDQTELAEGLLRGKVSTSTLEKWRCTGDGPPYIKVGRAVLYRQSAVLAWLVAQTVPHTQAAAAKPRRRHPSQPTAAAGE